MYYLSLENLTIILSHDVVRSFLLCHNAVICLTQESEFCILLHDYDVMSIVFDIDLLTDLPSMNSM